MTSSSLINKLSKDTNLTENERLEIISLITKQTEKVYGNKSNADKVGPKKNPSEYSDNPNAKYSLKNYYKHREEPEFKEKKKQQNRRYYLRKVERQEQGRQSNSHSATGSDADTQSE